MMRETLTKILNERGLRPSAFARMIGLKSSTIDDILKGRTNENNIGVIKALQIAHGLGISVEELYGFHTHYLGMREFADQEIAEMIKNARIKAGLTQKQLSEKLGKKQQTVASWETGQAQPNVSTFLSLFSLSNQSLDKILGILPEENLFSELNDFGKEKVLDYIQDLVLSNRYSSG